MNTPEASARLATAFPEFRRRRVVSIPNGFDSEDFAQAAPQRHDGIFRIVHSGYLHTDQGLRQRRIGRFRELLGGMPVPGVDLLTRSHLYLLSAVDKLVRADPDLSGVIEVHLVGQLTQADRDIAAPYPFVRLHGYKSHSETVSLVQSADLLFLPMHDLPASVRAGLVPGKAYEYMGSGRPILAAVPDGDARDMLLAAGTASVCPPAAVECMIRAIRERIDTWRAGLDLPQPNRAVLAKFERRSLTEQLANVLKEAVASSSGRSPATTGVASAGIGSATAH